MCKSTQTVQAAIDKIAHLYSSVAKKVKAEGIPGSTHNTIKSF